MAMQVNSSDDDEIIGSINTTPLVDVMLVLLIIFLIAIPVVMTSVRVELPQETTVVRETPPETLVVSVDREGLVFLYDAPVKSGQELFEQLTNAVARGAPLEMHIRGDKATNFEAIGRVIRAARRAGITKVGFITEPTGH